MRSLVLLLLACGCTVVDAPYPLTWDPLTASSTDCAAFRGRYADRGEEPGQSAAPSLTRELFGADSPWEKATVLRFEFPAADRLEVAVDGPKPVAQSFSAKSGDFRCEGGRLKLRARRWVTSDLMSGRETVTLDLHLADPYLVAHVRESTTGVMFMVVPLSGESARWFRFRKLGP